MENILKARRFYLLLFLPAFLSACYWENEKNQPDTNSLNAQTNMKNPMVPGDIFDLTEWAILLPVDENDDGKADTVSPEHLPSYSLPEFFFLNDRNEMVFAAANKAFTSPTSTNTRSELSQVFLNEQGEVVMADSPLNYFALASNPNASEFASVGGSLKATLRVEHVSINAGHPNKGPAYSVVVGQIHAGKLDNVKSEESGFGWGNEPLKIYFKKFPHHSKGSVFWNYERNLSKDNPNRIDIDYPVWGVGWENQEDPGEQGIALGETFSYTVNVYKDVMYLTFRSEGHPTVQHQINLADNVDANGLEDTLDDPNGYKYDWLFFKAGAYNQCSTKDAPSFRYPACPGSGNWKLDKQNGNYTQVAFSELKLGKAIVIEAGL